MAETKTILGCVRAGVEPGCILLVTSEKKEYSLHGASLPELGKGLGVSVTGTEGGVSHCLSGIPFQVHSWDWTRENCPK